MCGVPTQHVCFANTTCVLCQHNMCVVPTQHVHCPNTQLQTKSKLATKQGYRASPELKLGGNCITKTSSTT